MNKRKLGSTLMAVLMTGQLSLAGGLAFADTSAATYAHTNSELAARRAMVQAQMEQRVTPAKRQVAVNALKEERLKVYKAKQQVKQSKPETLDNK